MTKTRRLISQNYFRLTLLLLVTVPFTIKAQTWEKWFVSGNGYNPEGVFYGDLDGDGDLDIVSASRLDHTIGWFENKGNRKFSYRRTISTLAAHANSVHAGDIDGDGDLDVLSSSSLDDEIAWYENLGNGVFGDQHIISNQALHATSVHAKDMDNDGDVDVLSASTSDNRITYYENPGTGMNWQEQTLSANVYDASDVTTADLDGDGDLDVVAGARGNNSVVWLENLGGSTFGVLQVLSTSIDTKNVYPVDMDGDNDIDILFAEYYLGATSVYYIENLGGGTFATETILASGMSSTLAGIYAYDFDSDNDMDVLAGANSNFYIIENLGSMSFAAPLVHEPINSYEIHAADFDNDGEMDIITGGGAAADIYLHFNEGGLNFDSRKISHYAYRPQHITYSDLDCDGDLDILTASRDDYKIAWYENLGDGDFSYQYIISEQVNHAIVVNAADMDNDGDNDVITGSPSTDDVVWFENLGGGQFGPKQIVNTATDGTSNVIASDINGDGWLDLVSTSTWDDKLAWYENLTNGTFGAQQVISTSQDKPRGLAAGDLDGDGDNDVVALSDWGTNPLGWYENLGGGSFSSLNSLGMFNGNDGRVVKLHDLDLDGDLEIIANGNNVTYFENISPGVFGTQQDLYTTSQKVRGLEVLDINADGIPDITAGNFNNQSAYLFWWPGNGDLSFGNRLTIASDLRTAEMYAGADLDGDGDGDVMSAELIPNENEWYEYHFLEEATIQGDFFIDVNQNGVNDAGDLPYPNGIVHVVGGKSIGISGLNGVINFEASEVSGQYTVMPEAPNNWTVSAGNGGYPILIDSIGLPQTGLEFGLIPQAPIDSVRASLSSTAVSCGPGIYYSLNLSNIGSSQVESGIAIEMDPSMSISSTSVPPDSIVGDIFYWNMGTLNYFADSTILIEAQTSASQNDTLTHNFWSYTVNGSVIQTQPGDVLLQTVDCSTSGHIKSSMPSNVQALGNLQDSSRHLDFTVNFQNTSTDTVYAALIKDKLDIQLEQSSLEILAASHSFSGGVRYDGLIELQSQNIALPPASTNDIESRGYITYRVRVDPSTPLGYVVKNKATILFDCHEITTNSTNDSIYYCSSYYASLLEDIDVCFGDSVSISVPDQGLGSSVLWDMESYVTANGFDFTWQSDSVDTFQLNLTIANTLCNVDTTIEVRVHGNPPTTLPNISICEGDSALIFGNYLSQTGTYYDSLYSAYGCDSVIERSLVVNPVDTNSLTILNICQGDSVLLFGNYVSQSGTYSNMYTSTYGCDSLVEQEVIIIPTLPVHQMAPINICDGDSVLVFGDYISDNSIEIDTMTSIYGCDSVIEQEVILRSVYPNPIHDSVYICPDDSILLFGQSISTPGIYTGTLSSIYGCDSAATIELLHWTLTPVSLDDFSMDSICVNHLPISLPSGIPSGGIYSGNGVVGNQFDPSSSGNGLHWIYYTYTDGNGCESIDSTKIFVDGCANLQENVNPNIEVYPNPFDDELTIHLDAGETGSYSIFVYDVSGRLLIDKKGLYDNVHLLSKDNLSPGTYFLNIRKYNSDEIIHVERIVVK